MKPFILAISLLASFPAFSSAVACPPNRLCSGDRVIDAEQHVGSVVEVFSNGKAKITLDDYAGYYIRDIKTLGKGVPCFMQFCQKDRMIDSSNDIGRIEELFDNGLAKVSLDAYAGNYIRNLSQAGLAYRCIEDVCMGDRMIDSSNDVGRIEELFDNGLAKVSLDNYVGYYIRSFKSLGIELKCELRKTCRCRN